MNREERRELEEALRRYHHDPKFHAVVSQLGQYARQVQAMGMTVDDMEQALGVVREDLKLEAARTRWRPLP